jgi:Holliday junction resolvase RusA-like endonuclease
MTAPVRQIHVRVPGTPIPQGSTRAWVNPKTNRAVVQGVTTRLAAYRNDIRYAALEHFPEPLRGPVDVEIAFHFARPKSHLSRAGELRPSAPAHMTTRPDLDKLTRAVLDALTGIAWHDDSQVCAYRASKFYGPPHTAIAIGQPWASRS